MRSLLLTLAVGALGLASAHADSRDAGSPPVYQSHGIGVYHATVLQSHKAHTVKTHRASTPQTYRAHTIHVFTKRERAAMMAKTMRGYRPGRRRGRGLTPAQARAYGTLNHNIQAWYSGNEVR